MVPMLVQSTRSHRLARTYALLDTGSTSTFCSQKFIQDLNISDETVDVSVNTVEKEKDVTATIVSFQDGCGESHKLEC